MITELAERLADMSDRRDYQHAQHMAYKEMWRGALTRALVAEEELSTWQADALRHVQATSGEDGGLDEHGDCVLCRALQ